MGFKCAPQIKTLVMATEPKGKHTANGEKLLKEAGRERYSRSKTLDRGRSELNRYISENDNDFRNGKAAWDYMEFIARSHKRKVTKRNGKVTERAIGENQAIGWAVIINPPESVCAEWDDDTYEKFYNDAFDVLSEFNPVFREENWVFSAEHYDEGTDEAKEKDRHLHRFGFAMDIDGEFKGGNHIADPRSLSKLNQIFPTEMRKRGWAIDDLDTTDFERMKTDLDYRSERKQKWSKSGKDTNDFIETKNTVQEKTDAEKLMEIDATANEARDMLEDIKKMKRAAAEKLKKAIVKESELLKLEANIEYKIHLLKKTEEENPKLIENSYSI